MVPQLRKDSLKLSMRIYSENSYAKNALVNKFKYLKNIFENIELILYM